MQLGKGGVNGRASNSCMSGPEADDQAMNHKMLAAAVLIRQARFPLETDHEH